GFAIRYPEGWKPFGDAQSADVTLAPPDGIVSKGGGTQIGFGAAINSIAPQAGRATLRNATTDLIKQLQRENQQMSVTPGPTPMSVSGLDALSTTLRSNSPFGGSEVDTLITVLQRQKLWSIVFIAPERDQPRVESTFKEMLDSVHFAE